MARNVTTLQRAGGLGLRTLGGKVSRHGEQREWKTQRVGGSVVVLVSEEWMKELRCR
jgi:hypothetical protein